MVVFQIFRNCCVYSSNIFILMLSFLCFKSLLCLFIFLYSHTSGQINYNIKPSFSTLRHHEESQAIAFHYCSHCSPYTSSLQLFSRISSYYKVNPFSPIDAAWTVQHFWYYSRWPASSIPLFTYLKSLQSEDETSTSFPFSTGIAWPEHS